MGALTVKKDSGEKGGEISFHAHPFPAVEDLKTFEEG